MDGWAGGWMEWLMGRLHRRALGRMDWRMGGLMDDRPGRERERETDRLAGRWPNGRADVNDYFV